MYVHVCVCARRHVCTLFNTLAPNDAHSVLHGAGFISQMMWHMNRMIMTILVQPC
jgi:hypothetical protein